MNTKECIAICFGAIILLILLVSAILISEVSSRTADLIDLLSQPGLTDRVEIESLTVTTPDGNTVTLKGFDASVNSRFIDILLAAAASQQ